MKKVGFIGNGGSSLADRFLDSGRINLSEIIISSKSDSSRDVARAAKYIFLCTKPSETEMVLKEIKDCITPETNIISTDYPASIHFMESIVDCKVTRLASTMISENGRRVSVICHGSSVDEDEAQFIESLLCETCNAKVYKAKRF